ncbi:MAG TPA: tautomerase family protein [Xanthobacteraceae bacterium]|jgi:4-oxalocrotonate tautomerase|nr:tautomerase family protein [Xanthobacteraceae bacterium]
MPLVRIDLRRGKPAAYKKAISDGVYQALREIFTVPENDRFMVVTDRDEADFIYEPSYLGIEHGSEFVMLQITVTNTRTVEQKQALYARIVELLGKNPGIRPQDVMINLIDVGKENWSFGNGIAQYV